MTDHEILNAHAVERTKCLIYTRVMGYHRPVESFNTGKKGEHRQRRHFREFNAGGRLVSQETPATCNKEIGLHTNC